MTTNMPCFVIRASVSLIRKAFCVQTARHTIDDVIVPGHLPPFLSTSCRLLYELLTHQPTRVSAGQMARMEGPLLRRLTHTAHLGYSQSPVVHFTGGLALLQASNQFQEPSRSYAACQNVASEGIFSVMVTSPMLVI